jgi:hypothetical protein
VAVREKRPVTIYYAFENKSLKYFTKYQSLVFPFMAKGITVEKFPFDVSKMKLDDGRSIIEACYYGTFFQIVGNVESKCLNNQDSLFNFLSGKLAAHKEDIKFWVKHYTNFSIIDQTLLVDIASWLLAHKSGPLTGADIGVVIDRKNYGSSFILDYARQKGLAVMSIRTGRKLNENLFFIFCYNFLNLVSSCLSPFSGTKNKNKKPGNKICTYHYGDVSFSDFQYKRNYSLFWYPESGLDAGDILIFSQKSSEINANEIMEAEKNGFNLISCDGFCRKPNKLLRRHKSSTRSMRDLVMYCKAGLRLLLNAKNEYDYEVAKISFLLFLNLPYWEDFFKQHNVKILFKPGALFSSIDVAAKISGVVLISFQYSNLSRAAMGHLEGCDTFFVWGKEHEKAFSHEHNNVKTLIQSGYAFDFTFNKANVNAASLRKSFNEKGVNFILSFFDENLCGKHFVILLPIHKNIINLYRVLLRYAAAHKTTGLIVKMKIRANIDILRSDDELSGLIDSLEEEGRLKFLDSAKFPVEAGKASDLAIGMISESTAALECSLAGIPSVVFNSEGTLFSRNGHDSRLNRIVFEDADALISSIEKFRKNRPLSGGFADWGTMLDDKDPFRDGKANRRIGGYIKAVFSNINDGMQKDQAITKANKIYASLHGEDKVARFHQDPLYLSEFEKQHTAEKYTKDAVNLC